MHTSCIKFLNFHSNFPKAYGKMIAHNIIVTNWDQFFSLNHLRVSAAYTCITTVYAQYKIIYIS